MKYSHEFVNSIEQIGADTWQTIAEPHGPFCQYHFLHALEKSSSVGHNTGWLPQHLAIYANKQVIGLLPLYKKTHSYGEYVFDFAWANSYKQHGLNYYPKLVSAIPFTPVTGSRLLVRDGIDLNELSNVACQAIQQKIERDELSSMHWLFVDQTLSQILQENGQLSRRSVQFQWCNRQYTSFDEFLQAMNSRKRKSIRAERLKVLNSGIVIERLAGDELTQDHMAFFYQCYQQTYLKRSGHNGYLTEDFFKQIFATMHEKILLVIANKNNSPVASALFFYDENQLNGRYWGAMEDINSLHFECCYYQGIEFCIDNNIPQFNPGTQGEHKILRGFEPIYCYSNHQLKEPAFHDAVRRFIGDENESIEQYKQEAEKLLPFKKESDA